MNAPRLRAGVTFWQIAAVLAIILVTAAIVFPLFRSPDENTAMRRRGCASNLKQLGIAYVQYTQDSDEKLPSGLNAAGNGWAGEIYPYCKSVGVYQCPSDSTKGSHISYAANQKVSGQSLGAFAAPAATVELYETTALNCDPSSPLENVSTTGLSAPQNSDRHDADTFGLNFLAMNGHVKYLRPNQISSGPGALRPQKITQGQTGPAILTFAVK